MWNAGAASCVMCTVREVYNKPVLRTEVHSMAQQDGTSGGRAGIDDVRSIFKERGFKFLPYDARAEGRIASFLISVPYPHPDETLEQRKEGDATMKLNVRKNTEACLAKHPEFVPSDHFIHIKELHMAEDHCVVMWAASPSSATVK